MKKYLIIFFSLLLFQTLQAQNEFITVWKPGNSQQIHFPGRGTNFNVTWEETGYPQHNGNLTGVNSTLEFIVNFGNPQNPIPANATYRIKISNGSGSFNQVRFFDNTVIPIYNAPDKSKILDIVQWGNIQWQTFDNAFVFCNNMNVTALDSPNLNLVTTTKEMFYICSSLVGNASFNNWDMSNVTSINSMFSAADLFNAPIGNWDVSNVTDFYAVFDMANNFNQPLRNWNTSSATTMEHMFHGATDFNQNIDVWNTSGVTNMDMMFAEANSFNQNIGLWNLNSLVSAVDMFNFSGLDCQNYDNALYGWNNNSQTPNNINLGTVFPLYYKHSNAIAARSNLLISKNWNISGDNYNPNCISVLSTGKADKKSRPTIYPNPAKDFIYLQNFKEIRNYIISDMSGRIVTKDKTQQDFITIQHLSPGNYILQIVTNDKTHSFKFVKK